MLVTPSIAELKRFSNSHGSTATLVANTGSVVFAAGVNVNGALITRACMHAKAAADFRFALVANNGVPSGVTSGDGLMGGCGVAGALASFDVDELIYVRPGRGVYFICDQATTFDLRFCLYKLL